MSYDDFSFLFFFLFLFLFFFSLFFARLELGCQEFRETRRVFLVPHSIYLTLPFTYLHNLRYVNLSNIRYLFTYQTSSQPPNLLYLYPSAFRALLSPLSSWFGQSHRSNQFHRSNQSHRPHLLVKSCHLPYLEKNLNSFPYTWYLWSFIPHPKSKNFEFEFPYP